MSEKNRTSLCIKNEDAMLDMDIQYQFIPETLGSSIAIWLFLLLVFFLFRKNAFNFMRTELYLTLSVWLKGFEEKPEEDDPPNENLDPEIAVDEDKIEEETEDENENPPDPNPIADTATKRKIKIKKARKKELKRRKRNKKAGSGFISFMKNSFECLFYSDKTMMRLAGRDAVNYLGLQKYIIGFLLLLTIISLVIILPLNYQGIIYAGSGGEFGKSTIENLDSASVLLYVHSMLSFLLFPITIFWMRKFSENIGFRDVGLKLTRTLLVENIPLHNCKIEMLQRHFREAYPSHEIVDIQVAYEVANLTRRSNRLKDARDSLELGEKYREENEDSLYKYPINWSRFLGFCCSCIYDKVDVVDYYRQEVDRLSKEVAQLTEESLDNPLGIAFVSFDDINSSKAVHDDFQRNYRNYFLKMPMKSSVSTVMRPDMWSVSYAPLPREVIWTSLRKDHFYLLKKIVIYGVLFLVGLFFTTPEFISHEVNKLLDEWNQEEELPEWVLAYIPNLFLNISSFLMPALITFSIRLLSYKYTSHVEYYIFRNIFVYLMIVVIFFPTLGLTSMQELIDQITVFATDGTTVNIQWECFFNPDTSSFFINYLIFATFVGTALELLTVGYVISYAISVISSRTPANMRAIKRNLSASAEFNYGENYARMLMVHAMTTMYCFSCPLITPVGLVYFILKHLVDKHNLTWVFSPNEVNIRVHGMAIKIVLYNVLNLQIFLTVVSSIKTFKDTNRDNWYRISISIALLALSVIVYVSQAFPDLCRKMSPIKYADIIFPEEEYHVSSRQYIPEVLREVLGNKTDSQETQKETEEDD